MLIKNTKNLFLYLKKYLNYNQKNPKKKDRDINILKNSESDKYEDGPDEIFTFGLTRYEDEIIPFLNLGKDKIKGSVELFIIMNDIKTTKMFQDFLAYLSVHCLEFPEDKEYILKVCKKLNLEIEKENSDPLVCPSSFYNPYTSVEDLEEEEKK